MPLINTIKPEDATGELAALYDQIKTMRGRVGNNAQLFSSSPGLFKTADEFHRALYESRKPLYCTFGLHAYAHLR